MNNYAKSVSYTHLDVYKRQGEGVVMMGLAEVDGVENLDAVAFPLQEASALYHHAPLRVLSIRNKKKSILLLSGFIAAVVLDKAHNLVRKGFPAGFAEMDMNVKGRAADVLHKVGFRCV